MTTTHYAAIESGNITGRIYGVGTAPEAAVRMALDAGDPCVAHGDRKEGHGPADHFAVVPCTAGAAAYVQRFGGAPSDELTVTARDGVMLRAEEGDLAEIDLDTPTPGRGRIYWQGGRLWVRRADGSRQDPEIRCEEETARQAIKNAWGAPTWGLEWL